MGLKFLKSITPSSRGVVLTDKSALWKGGPEKSLVSKMHSKGGRNSFGRITVRHHGGGHKRRYRIVDFKRNKTGKALVERIEYDPNRTAFLALISYSDGSKSYIIAPHSLKVGDYVESGENIDICVGNNLPLKSIPSGSFVHNIELKIGKGGVLARSAGGYAQVMGKNGEYVTIRLPSGEMRDIYFLCRATIGVVSNMDNKNVKLGKAGRSRWMGIRPTVRGVAMNPVDHPHGGGEGKTSGGRHPVTPWGVSTKGKKTRKKNKYTNKYIKRFISKG